MVPALPRDASGKPRIEILQLVAMNQLDQLDATTMNKNDRALLMDILEQRKNLRDRFNFDDAEAEKPMS